MTTRDQILEQADDNGQLSEAQADWLCYRSGATLGEIWADIGITYDAEDILTALGY